MNSKWEEKLLLLCVIKEGFKVFSAFLGKNQEKCVCVCVCEVGHRRRCVAFITSITCIQMVCQFKFLSGP